jgi:NAD(P)-dependent dehydrogenase (short-subunit alcohol dehydrogenase family)
MKNNLLNLEGKTAIVTGAAGGLGSVVAVGLAKQGARIVLADIADSGLEKTLEDVRKAGGPALCIHADVTSRKSVQAMMDQAVKAFDRIDILINNAGISARGPAESLEESDWDRVIAVNLKGPFLCSQAAGRVMIGQKAGSIVNVASVVGQRGLLHRHDLAVAYCCSKGGLIQLTKALAAEWACHGIRVNAVAPTYLQTDLTNHLFENPDFKSFVLGKIPLGRLPTPQEVVGAVAFLASEASSMVTGHVLDIDGGWLAV